MKIIVLGAGVIGVTTAYFLARQGYQVTVIDKNSDAANSCSRLNGGQLSYSHIETWAAKESITSLLKAIFKTNSFLSINAFNDGDFWKWLAEFYKNSKHKIAEENSLKLFKLANVSRNALAEILKEEKIDFCYKKEGILHFFRSTKTFNESLKHASFLQSAGVKLQILDAAECIKKEPTLIKLQNEKKLAGGIFYENDASGDCSLFTKALARICKEKYGVNFKMNCQIKNIFTNKKIITGVNTNKGVYVADKYIYALGAEGNSLLKGIEISSKIYPLKGYSLSILADQEFVAPNLSLTDSENKIVYSRLGNIFRAAGTVEISGFRKVLSKKHLNFIKKVIKSSFLNYGNLAKTESWQGFRPFRPSSIPLICESKKYPNLLINSGHGSLGWTLSAGSAKIIANILANNQQSELQFLQDENV